MIEILEDLKNFKFTFNPDNYEKVSRWGVEFHTEETKQLISRLKMGTKHTPEHIEKVRLSRLGSKQTDYQKQRVAETFEAAWIVTNPEGKAFNIVNLRKFCRSNGLDQGNMVKVSKGILKQHKGWNCSKVDPK